METLSRPKARWTGEEEALMADFELDHPGMRITEMANQIHAQVLRHWSVEAIRCRQRLTSYKRLVGVLAASRGEESPRRVTHQLQGRMGVASANQPILENEDEDPGEADLEERGSLHARREERVKEATEERVKSALGNAVKKLSDRLGIPIPNSLRDVLDAQVVADAAHRSLHQAHEQKVAYYNTSGIRDRVLELTGHSPTISSLTVSWRGVIAPASMKQCKRLNLVYPKKMLTSWWSGS